MVIHEILGNNKTGKMGARMGHTSIDIIVGIVAIVIDCKLSENGIILDYLI